MICPVKKLLDPFFDLFGHFFDDLDPTISLVLFVIIMLVACNWCGNALTDEAHSTVERVDCNE